MADLAARHEPPTNLAAIWDDLDRLRREVAYLRSSRGTIRNATFPTGVIPANALDHATSQPGLVNITTTAFGLSATPTDLIAATVTVPVGFSSCVVSLTGRVYAANPTAVSAYLSAQVAIAGTTGNAVPVLTEAAGSDGDAALNVATLAIVGAGMSAGSTFTVSLKAWTDAATWAADPSNLADLTGSIVWFA